MKGKLAVFGKNTRWGRGYIEYPDGNKEYFQEVNLYLLEYLPKRKLSKLKYCGDTVTVGGYYINNDCLESI